MIDLCYILLQYCARKTKELASQDEEDGLGLKKMHSVVDEMSMSTILNQNFTFLIGLLKEDMQVFETISDHLTKKEYDVFTNHTISDRNEKTMIDAVVARVTDKYSKVELAELPEDDRKAIEDTIKQASSKLSSYYESTKDLATHFFIDYLPKGTFVFEYPLVVSLRGDMSNGITTIQFMYAPEFTSHSLGIRVKVE